MNWSKVSATPRRTSDAVAGRGWVVGDPWAVRAALPVVDVEPAACVDGMVGNNGKCVVPIDVVDIIGWVGWVGVRNSSNGKI